MRTHTLKRISFLLLLSLCSCSIFQSSETLTVVSCSNQNQFIVVDSVKNISGKIELLDVVYDSIPAQHWVILPDTSLSSIYQPCNLPYQARQKNKEIKFSGYLLEKLPGYQYELVHGMRYFELTAITIYN